MKTLKVQILKHIMDIPRGYRPTNPGSLVASVSAYVEKQKDKEDVVELFGILCKSEPATVAGGGFIEGLKRMAAHLEPPKEVKGKTMTLEEIEKMTSGSADVEPEYEDDGSGMSAQAVIESAGQKAPKPRKKKPAENVPDPDDLAERHRQIIEKSQKAQTE